MRDSVEAWLKQEQPAPRHDNSPWLQSLSASVTAEELQQPAGQSSSEVRPTEASPSTAYMENPMAAAYTTQRAVRPTIVTEEDGFWGTLLQEARAAWAYQISQPVGVVYLMALAGCLVMCTVVHFAWPVNASSKVGGTALQALQEELSSEASLERVRLAVGKPDAGSLPNFNRHDPFEPLLSTAAVEDALALDPLNGFNFMGLIRGDGKTKDVVIVEVPSSDPAGVAETMIQPLGSVLERSGVSVRLLRCSETELTVSVNGQTRQLALLNVVDEAAALASNPANGANGTGAVPPAGGGAAPGKAAAEDPNGEKLLNSLDR
jgi:hypothetical protein